MRAYSLKEIYEALQYGSEQGYCLFPELMDRCSIEQIKKNKVTAALSEEIRKAAAAAAQHEIIPLRFLDMVRFEQDGNRSAFEKHYNRNSLDLTVMVLADYLDGEEKYLPLIEERLWQWLNEYTWELPAHFALRPENVCFLRQEGDVASGLSSTSMAFNLVEILAILEPKLHPLIVKRIKHEINRRVLRPYLNGLQFWEGGGHNWAAVCAGGIGAAALYSDMAFEDLTAVVSRVIAAMTSYFQTLSEDGSSTEGLSYWSYGFSYFTFFACLLRERTCGKIDLFQDDFVKLTARFPLVMQFPDGYAVNFADTPSDRYDGNLGFLTKISEIMGYAYRVPDSQVITSTFLGNARNLFWGAFSDRERKKEILTGVFQYETAQIVAARGYTQEGDFCAVVMKGGFNMEPHNHNDVGQFLVHIENCPVIVDLGSPPYTKQTFEDETRFEMLQCSSASHNVPEIDGHFQLHGNKYRAERVEAGENFFKLDIAGAYETGVCQSLMRKFCWDLEQAHLYLQDDFIFINGGHRITERFATRVKPVLREGAAVLTCGEYEFTIRAEGANAVWKETEYLNHMEETERCWFVEFEILAESSTQTVKIEIDGKKSK